MIIWKPKSPSFVGRFTLTKNNRLGTSLRAGDRRFCKDWRSWNARSEVISNNTGGRANERVSCDRFSVAMEGAERAGDRSDINLVLRVFESLSDSVGETRLYGLTIFTEREREFQLRPRLGSGVRATQKGIVFDRLRTGDRFFQRKMEARLEPSESPFERNKKKRTGENAAS